MIYNYLEISSHVTHVIPIHVSLLTSAVEPTRGVCMRAGLKKTRGCAGYKKKHLIFFSFKNKKSPAPFERAKHSRPGKMMS